MESHLLSAALSSRENLYKILDFIAAKQYSREFQIIMGKLREYYDRDANADHVVKDVFLAMLEASVQNKKHLENFVNIINEAEGTDTSDANIQELILKTKVTELRTQLAVALMNDGKNVAELMEELREIQHYTTLDELAHAGTEMLTHEDAEEVLNRLIHRVGMLKVYPQALDERLDGGAAGGHHIVIFARPEMGKSAQNITMACGFARQRADGIYFINEDRTDDIYTRIVSNLSGMTVNQVKVEWEKAIRIARENGLEHIRLIGLTPGTPKQIEAFIDKYRPKWCIVDQIRNLDMKEANKVLQLEFATSAMRNLGKKYNVLMCSATQAGDSGEGKKLLTMGDIDFSNTGVAAQADVLIGIGGDMIDVQEGRRIFNITKNKIAARHENFPVKLVAPLSRYVSYRGDNNEQ